MLHPFTDHPRAVGETYWQHLGQATGFGVSMILGGFACLAHGLFPFLFTKTGSRTIQTLHTRMVTHRSRADRARLAGESAPQPAE